MPESILFTWLQGAPFYQDLHARAVHSVPARAGAFWLDVGCGPGLVTRLAASRGYRAKGIDASPRMIKAARRLARRHHSSAEFEVGTIAALPFQYADVVSAASLLAVVEDKPSNLSALWQCVRPGGHLLIIEPTVRMNPENAATAIADGLPRKRIRGLRLWAAARRNKAVDPRIYGALDGERRYVDLLDGLVGAWILRKGLVRDGEGDRVLVNVPLEREDSA